MTRPYGNGPTAQARQVTTLACVDTNVNTDVAILGFDLKSTTLKQVPMRTIVTFKDVVATRDMGFLESAVKKHRGN